MLQKRIARAVFAQKTTLERAREIARVGARLDVLHRSLAEHRGQDHFVERERKCGVPVTRRAPAKCHRSAVFRLVRGFLVAQIEAAQAAGELVEVDPEPLAEVAVRRCSQPGWSMRSYAQARRPTDARICMLCL